MDGVRLALGDADGNPLGRAMVDAMGEEVGDMEGLKLGDRGKPFGEALGEAEGN